MVAVLPSDEMALARQARERFIARAEAILNALPDRIIAALETQGPPKTAIGKIEDMETEAALRQKSGAWLVAVQRRWRRQAAERHLDKPVPGAPATQGGDLAGLTLVDDAEMDRTVAVGRLALSILNQAGQELSDLRARMQRLEHSADFTVRDVLRPEIFAKALLDGWADCGLAHAQWARVREAVHQCVTQGLRDAYKDTNAFLMEHGVSAEIDLRARVRRTPDRVTASMGLPSGMGSMPASFHNTWPGGLHTTGFGGSYGPSGPNPMTGGADGLAYAPPGSAGQAGHQAVPRGGAANGAAANGFVYAPPGSTDRAQYEAALYTGAPGAGAGAATANGNGDAPVVAVVSPLGMLQQQRAQGVLGHLRQFALQHGAPLAAEAGALPVSPVLALALAEPGAMLTTAAPYPSRSNGKAEGREAAPTEVDDAARQFRSQAEALKEKAERSDEKAAIEIVSLMFQAILTDERLPPALRVWFGRLQVPVLRVALAEPEFFAAPDHPARRLIDRMGACAMGLDNTTVDGERLEQEIKRITQMIEQYPETGQKVFQVMLAEFEKFIGSALTQGKHARKFATLAQQIEQKEALAIQYTIELRNMLSAVPVSGEVRQFLLRVWAEVLALAAVRRGAQDAETMRLKQAAVDLLWAVSPKTDRAGRQQVTQHLSDIVRTLRAGMGTLAMQKGEQDRHIRLIKQAVAQAFHSLKPGITPAQMNQLARALTGLEDVVSDDPEGDLLLDPALLEQMLGVDNKALEVIAAGGVRPDADMLQWAREQQPGQWFRLQYQDAPARVQYVWRSARGQLHLFAAASGKNYLVQTRRLASYLQAGLIVPVENEPLTIRATRHALTQLGQEPERLLC